MNEISMVYTNFKFSLFWASSYSKCNAVHSLWFPHSTPCVMGSTEILHVYGNIYAVDNSQISISYSIFKFQK